MHLKKQMIAIAAVCNNWLAKSRCHQPLHCLSSNSVCCFLFFCRCTDTAGADWVCINQNPLKSYDVIVRRCFLRTFYQTFMLSTRIAGTFDGVQRLVKRSIRILCQFSSNARTVRTKITADSRLRVYTPDFNDCIRFMQQGQPLYCEFHCS